MLTWRAVWSHQNSLRVIQYVRYPLASVLPNTTRRGSHVHSPHPPTHQALSLTQALSPIVFPAQVPPRSRGEKAARYKLSFRPAWLGEERARLVFHCPSTGESFDYVLTGIGDEPLAEASLSIKCKAREGAEVRGRGQWTGSGPARSRHRQAQSAIVHFTVKEFATLTHTHPCCTVCCYVGGLIRR